MKDEAAKHAFCIMAHDDQECLETLVNLLDHPLNDIFIHIDKKSDKIDPSKLRTVFSRLHVIPFKKRINVNWGGLSQVKAELLLFGEALKEGKYNYIHLLSGADLPLKSNQEIHEFFSSLPDGSNVVSFSHGKKIEENVNFKTRYYHPLVEFQRFRKDGNPIHLIQDALAKTIRFSFVSFQKLIRYKRNWGHLCIKKGSQWVSVTPQFAEFLILKTDYILKRFKGVICPDEIFLHTMLFNSNFKETVWDYEGINDNPVRLIDWRRGSPYVWRVYDYNELKESKALFARKFSSDVDAEIIDKIKNLKNADD